MLIYIFVIGDGRRISQLPLPAFPDATWTPNLPSQDYRSDHRATRATIVENPGVIVRKEVTNQTMMPSRVAFYFLKT